MIAIARSMSSRMVRDPEADEAFLSSFQIEEDPLFTHSVRHAVHSPRISPTPSPGVSRDEDIEVAGKTVHQRSHTKKLLHELIRIRPVSGRWQA
jgi:hypothetical protein